MNARAMPWSGSPRGFAWPAADARFWLLAALALLLALHLSASFGRAIGAEEFRQYAQLQQLLAGTLADRLETLHLRAFAWIDWLPFGNLGQIIAARFGMFAFVVATAAATYGLARGFAGRNTALLCALAWLSAGFVMHHATSFRVDAMAAALLMAALAVMINSRLGIVASLLVAELVALAMLVTFDSVLLAPAFIGLAWLRWQEAGRTFEASLRLAALGLMVPGLFALFYLLHLLLLPDPSDPAAIIASALSRFANPLQHPFPDLLAQAALSAPVLLVCLALFPVALWRSGDFTRAEKFALAGLTLPLAATVFHADAGAQVYTLVLAPAAVAALVVLRIATRRFSLVAIAGAMVLSGLTAWVIEDRTMLSRQRAMIAAADSLFAQPVGYIDGIGMLGHFPRSAPGPAGDMAQRLAERPVPLAIENTRRLARALGGTGPVAGMSAHDLALLRDTYVPFWGPFWLAGEVVPIAHRRTAQIRVPGTYTVHDGALMIDDDVYLPGETVTLARGRVELATFARASRLLWGDRLTPPEASPPARPYWPRD